MSSPYDVVVASPLGETPSKGGILNLISPTLPRPERPGPQSTPSPKVIKHKYNNLPTVMTVGVFLDHHRGYLVKILERRPIMVILPQVNMYFKDLEIRV